MMGLDQKSRSLHCGMQAGLSFQEIDGERVIFLRDVPFEWENIIENWINALPSNQSSEESSGCILRYYTEGGPALTEDGWSEYISWMSQVLRAAQESKE